MEDNNIGALSAINLLPSTDVQVKIFSQLIIDEVIQANCNPLKLNAQLKFVEKTLKLITEGIRHYAEKEHQKYGQKTLEMHGFKIQYSENIAPKYDYASCNDPKWNELDEMIKKLNDQKKQRESFLKTISGHVEVPDESTGEMVVVNPPQKKSTTGLIFEAI